MDSEIREWNITLGDIPVAFHGHLLADVDWRPQTDGLEEEYWEGLFILRTPAGRYVCRKIVQDGENETESFAVLPNFAEIRRFFGYGWLAEELYKKAGLTPK